MIVATGNAWHIKESRGNYYLTLTLSNGRHVTIAVSFGQAQFIKEYGLLEPEEHTRYLEFYQIRNGDDAR